MSQSFPIYSNHADNNVINECNISHICFTARTIQQVLGAHEFNGFSWLL